MIPGRSIGIGIVKFEHIEVVPNRCVLNYVGARFSGKVPDWLGQGIRIIFGHIYHRCLAANSGLALLLF